MTRGSVDRYVRCVLAVLPLCLGVWCAMSVPAPVRGEEPADPKLKKLAADARTRAQGIEVKLGERGKKATLQPDPLIKYTDVPRQIEMATLWIWHDDGRPVALGKVEAYPGKGA